MGKALEAPLGQGFRYGKLDSYLAFGIRYKVWEEKSGLVEVLTSGNLVKVRSGKCGG